MGPREEAILFLQGESERFGEVLYPDLLDSKNTGNDSPGQNVGNFNFEKAEENWSIKMNEYWPKKKKKKSDIGRRRRGGVVIHS